MLHTVTKATGLGRAVLDARAAGLAVGAVLLWLRAPALVALMVAAAVTAVVRVAGG